MPKSATIVQAGQPQQRRPRYPAHPFQLRHQPMEIQPFLCAPVLPGETVKNVALQARVVSDPVKNPLVGCWMEYYIWYCKFRDLNERGQLTDMLVDASYNMTPLQSAATAFTYNFANGVDYTKMCLTRCVETYFRDENETATGGPRSNGAIPLAQIKQRSWLDSAINFAYLPGTDLDPTNTDNLTDQELDQKMRTYDFLRMNNMTSLKYEDWLRSYGVQVPKQELMKPELIRYFTEWTYPTNTVDPVTGAPSTCWSWSIRGNADKDIFCMEPGFIFGATICRPKVYLNRQVGAALHAMQDTFSWLPAVMADDPASSLKNMGKTVNNPIGVVTDTGGYWTDMRDLFLYGDQFINFDVTSTAMAAVALPTAALQKRYIAMADIQALFKGTTAATQLVRQDGIVNLTILGTQQDYTPRHTGDPSQ